MYHFDRQSRRELTQEPFLRKGRRDHRACRPERRATPSEFFPDRPLSDIVTPRFRTHLPTRQNHGSQGDSCQAMSAKGLFRQESNKTESPVLAAIADDIG